MKSATDTKNSLTATARDILSRGQRMLRGFELALIPLSVIAALIFIRVGADRPLWLDEADSIQFASQSLGGALESLRNDVNLPAYYLILHPWIALFGDSETAARSLSGLLYLATIGVVFQTGRFLFSDRRSAFYCPKTRRSRIRRGNL